MKLSKNQIVLIALGCVTVVAVAVLGFLAFGAFSENSDAAEELDLSTQSVRQMCRAKIPPSAQSVTEINSNRTALADWRESLLAVISDGDKAPAAGIDEASFKQQMVDDARELAKLPGGVEGAIVAADFTFGFKAYISGGELPEKARLPQLQRQWADIKLLVGRLSDCGVTELVKIEPTANPAAVQEPRQDSRKPNRRNRAAEEEKPAFTRECYALEFRARPLALVKAVNAFATDSRFIVVDALSFSRPGDMIASALAGDEKQGTTSASSGGRRRRRGIVEAESEAEAAPEAEKFRRGLINSPETEAPFMVRMTVSTYDFGTRSAADAAQAEAKDETKNEEGNE